jgi:membrane associated rhomboid family serine protease
MAKNHQRKEAGTFVLRVNGFALILLISAILSGLVTDTEGATFEYHVVLGLAASVFGLFGLTLLLFYIIMTGAYIKERIRQYNLDRTLIDRLSGIKSSLFPPAMLAILLLIVSPVSGAAMHTGNGNNYLHLFTTITCAVIYFLALRRAKKELLENRAIAQEVLGKSGDTQRP